MQSHTDRLFHFSQRGYYLSFLAIIVALAAGYLLAGSFHFNKASDAGIAVQSLVFMFLMISLPGALWGFHRQTLVLQKLEDIRERVLKYKRLIVLRLIVVNLNIVVNLLLFFFSSDKSFFMCAAIAAIFLLFCRPSVLNIEKDLGFVQNEVENEE